MTKHDKQFRKGQIPWNKGKHTGNYGNGFKRGMTAWNAGKKTGLVPKTAFKVGNKAPKTAFRKGQCPWNKDTIGIMTPWNKGLKGYKIGELNNRWKGGITPENVRIRTSLEYKLWRKSCFDRDNFTCQKTGISGGCLVVHHINNFSEFPELRFAIDNGITLSKKAHREFHKKYGFKNNTQEQVNNFLK